MSERGVRLPLVFAAATVLAVGVTVIVLHSGAVAVLADTPRAADAVGRRLLGWGAALVVAAAAFGAVAGARIGASLERLRAALGLAGDDSTASLPRSRIIEVQRVVQAAGRATRSARDRAAGLESERQYLDQLVHAVSEGLLGLDARGRITFANPAAHALLSLPRKAIGQPLASLMRTLELRAVTERALRGEVVDTAEVSVGERRLLVSARALPGRNGVAVAILDTTEVRRLEGVRRDFVANVSHELKTPLTSIRGYLETVLQDESVPDDVRRQFLEVAARNAERLQRIVDELLDLARIESGRWHPDLQAIDAGDAVREAWLACELRARAQRIAFVPPGCTARVLADPGALRQVLGNLFDNALRHTPDGTIEVRLRREAAPGSAGDRVTFEVRDTGSGIPRDALPRIFERFYRVDPARSRLAGGTGLGLAIVKHLVDAMGGAVSAESEVGKGTTIRFHLPAKP